MQLTLKRVSTNCDGTFGVLLLDTLPLCVTLEESWKNNLPNESCIPAGIYMCQRYYSKRFGSTFKVMDVPGRSDIVFHWGNTEVNTQGCVLIGDSYGAMMAFDDDENEHQMQPAIIKSKYAFKKLIQKLHDKDELCLSIIWV
ncbi:hypothetical protein H8E50_03775 [bacterium]|nr:hypothetical protein [bacterium]